MRQFVLDIHEDMVSTPAMEAPRNAKELGAYYTDSQVAEFLVSWALTQAGNSVCDPSFGGGVFLRAAAKRLRTLSSQDDLRIFGVEVDPSVHATIKGKLVDEFSIDPGNLMLADFFALRPGHLQVDAVVGNPPFIRFHRFAGSDRERALGRALESGVRLSKLASSWAPFLVHAMS